MRWSVCVSARVSYSTEVEASCELEAKRKAFAEWEDCNIDEMDFLDIDVECDEED